MGKERKNSLASRNVEGIRHRKIDDDFRGEKLKCEHENYELKLAGDNDVVKYKKECVKERKNSLASRNAEGIRHRKIDDDLREDKLKCEHESYELKWAGDNDVVKYKKECEKERKNSLAFRNAEGIRHRKFDDDLRVEKLKCEHESYELKWVGDNDVVKYKKECEKERKNSLAFRNVEGIRHRKIDDDLRVEKLKCEHESYELKLAGDNDV